MLLVQAPINSREESTAKRIQCKYDESRKLRSTKKTVSGRRTCVCQIFSPRQWKFYSSHANMVRNFFVISLLLYKYLKTGLHLVQWSHVAGQSHWIQLEVVWICCYVLDYFLFNSGPYCAPLMDQTQGIEKPELGRYNRKVCFSCCYFETYTWNMNLIMTLVTDV